MNIDPIERLDINTWGIQEEGDKKEIAFKLCIKRVTGYNYMNKQPFKENKCYENEILCGMNTNSEICIPKSSKCPVTNILL